MSTCVLRCSLGDLDVTQALLRLPAIGNWVAHLELGWPEAPTGAASLLLAREDGTVDSFTGTIRRSGIFDGAELVDVTLVGGKGALIADVAPREHAGAATSIPAGIVARSIVDAAGEVLAPGVEAALDALPLQRWTRMRMAGGLALDALAHALGLTWRVLPSGQIWMGSDTWPDVDATRDRVGGDPRDGSTLYALDGAPLLPGSSIDGARAAIVEYSVMPGRARTRVGAELAGDPVRAPDLTLYRASYAGDVRAQRSNGTLDIHPDDVRLPDLLAVPFYLGIPGAKVTIPEGSRVRVAFEGADPRRAYATALEQDAAAAAAFSLVGDAVNCGSLTASVAIAPGAVTFVYTPPGGGLSTGTTVTLGGKVTGPGHAYLQGVSG